MKTLKYALALTVVAVVATGCCCPLELCLGGGGLPQGMAPTVGRSPGETATPVVAAAPVAPQRF